ncbi:unnamed protein product [Rangifer tarandus platyrhynchus]|uniref:Uncharacterized protein n=2 Tax=Rangifer tarandus platyrhynchus TaxID=3082113 RepID=A0AC59ZKZ8_RANTA|nr:unnamed protein product [Rangifer tarandus platyrhynchus]
MSSPKWLLPVSVFSGGVPVASWYCVPGPPRSGGVSKPPFRSLPLCWDLGACENLHVPFKEGLCYPQPCGSCTQAPLAFVARCSEYLSSQCRTSRLGSPVWALPPSLLGQNLTSCDDPSICDVAYSRKVGLD